MKKKIGLVALFMIICMVLSACGSSSSYSGSSSSASEKCSICGGKLKCAICGESGLYCENASYGSGNDHYCSKHWSDVVEWHEKK
jgi:hypothetical protein